MAVILKYMGKYCFAAPLIALTIAFFYAAAPLLFLAKAVAFLEGPDEIKRFFREYYVEFPVAAWKWLSAND